MKTTLTPIKTKKSPAALAQALAILALVTSTAASQAADVFKADNLGALNQPTSWDGAVVPTATDIAVWDNRVATAIPQNISLGADTNWSGIRILDPGSAVSIVPGNILTLGAGGIDTSGASQSLTLSNATLSGAAQSWNIVAAVTVRGALTNTPVNLITKTGGGTLTLANANPSGRIQIDEGLVSSSVTAGSSLMTLALNGGTFTVNAALSHPVDVMAGGGILQNAGGNRTLSGSISGNGPLTVNAGSIFTWNASNSFSGTATIQGSGAVRLSNLNAVSSNATYIVNSTMNPNASGTFHLGSFSGSGFLGGGAGQNFSVGALNTDSIFSGVISSAGLISKVGTGTFTLDGANTYAGATLINNGVLQIGSGGSTGKFGTGSVTNNSRLVFNRGDALVSPNAIHGVGGVTNIGFGKVSLTGANTYSGPTTVTAGTLAFGTASSNTGDVTIENAATLGAVVTSSGATLTQGNATFVSGGSYEFDLGTFGNHPGTVVSNTGIIALNGNVTVNLTGTNFSNGTITLLRYASRAGVGSFVIGSLPANVNLVSFSDDTANKQVLVTITAGPPPVDMTFKWVGDTAGVWDIDNQANQIWTVVGTSQTTNYTEGAAVLFDDTAAGTTNINLITLVNPSVVTVNNTNKTYTLGGVGSVSGATGLTKKGPGTLIVTNANSFSGQTAVEAGSIRVAGETGAIGGGGVTNNGALILDRTEATNALPNTLSFFGQITGTGALTILGVDSTNSIVQLNVGTSDGNPYSGGTLISNSFVRLAVSPSSDATRSAAKSTGIGSGQITFLGDSILQLHDYGVGNNDAQSGTFAAPLHVPAGQIGTFRTAGRMTVSSSLTGSGTFNLAVSYIRDVISGNLSAFTGQMNVTPSPNATGNEYQIANAAGLPAGKLHVAAGVTMGGQSPVVNNSVVPIGELSGEVGSVIANVGGSPRNINFKVGGLNTSSTFAGNFGGNHSLTKEGTGTLTLSGVNSYTGTTTVSNGVLALVEPASCDSNSAVVLGSSTAILDVSGRTDGALNVGNSIPQTLRGVGTINGRLNLAANSTNIVELGTMTVTNVATLNGTLVMQLNRTNVINASRFVAGSLVNSSILAVANVGPDLQGGDTFQLFNGAVTGFTATNLPALTGVKYWMNNLAVNGTIAVVDPINPHPPQMQVSVSGNTLSLAWPTNAGWILQSNSVSVADSTSWFNYPANGAVDVTNVDITIDPSRTNVFFRMLKP